MLRNIYFLQKYTLTNSVLIFEASAFTHAHERSKVGCGIYAYILLHLLADPTIMTAKVIV